MADNDYIEKNVCEKVVLKSVKPIADITYLTDEEVKTVFTGILKDKNVMDYDHLDVFGMRDYLIIALGIDTGIRKGSMTEIELKDIDLQNGRLSLIQKGNKELVLELGEHIIEMINKYLVKDKNIWIITILNCQFYFIVEDYNHYLNQQLLKLWISGQIFFLKTYNSSQAEKYMCNFIVWQNRRHLRYG